MNCEWINTNGALYLYDELADDARHELETHLNRCPDCSREFQGLREFHQAMKTVAVAEPSASMLAASRMKLQEALENTEQARGWSRFTVDLAGWMHQLKFAPALAAVLLMAGFGAGILTTYSMVAKPGVKTDAGSGLDSASVASIRGITQEANSNNVSIKYDRIVSDTAQGSVDDPRIQQLLLYAARSNFNSGLRLDSIDVLTRKSEDDRVREVMIFALRYDKNPGVRLKALESLTPYVKDDVRVRDVMLEVLMRDSNPGVRSGAIQALNPVKGDSSVREALQVLASQSDNSYLRSEARRLLGSVADIE